MVIFGHYAFSDIQDMYYFEMVKMYKLLVDSREKINKANLGMGVEY